ncbi:hypothetical protein RhiirA4_481407 [Rhizophagus irregularis]|uniref:Uncharacterized protein n=1 Tax=Rhizophagus irregularis TaxID=588596 RepID=A0A2I1HJI0_9GLOM|nr:hypothetical protein RhiirA4_481407 [Rhizophagus irregularis]
MALSKDTETKKDLKWLKEINLTDDKYKCSYYSTIGFMCPAVEKLKNEFAPLVLNKIHANIDLESPDDAFDEHNFEDALEENKPAYLLLC